MKAIKSILIAILSAVCVLPAAACAQDPAPAPDPAKEDVFLAGFENWSGMNAPSSCAASSLARSIAPVMPFAPSVSTTWAPYARMSFMRSALMVFGMVSTTLYPLAAPIAASPMPVLPEVGSIIVAPGRSLPSRSAASIILSATLSFTEPAGLNISAFASSAAPTPARAQKLSSFISGVSPISFSIP